MTPTQEKNTRIGFGVRIKELMLGADLNQTQLANLLHIDPSYVSTWVNHDVWPKDALIDLICQRFKVRRNWLEFGERPKYEDRFVKETRERAKYQAD